MGKEKSDVIHFGQTSKICHKYFNEAVQLLSAEFMQTGSVVEKKCQNVSRQCVRTPEKAMGTNGAPYENQINLSIRKSLL